MIIGSTGFFISFYKFNQLAKEFENTSFFDTAEQEQILLEMQYWVQIICIFAIIFIIGGVVSSIGAYKYPKGKKKQSKKMLELEREREEFNKSLERIRAPIDDD